MFATLIGCLTCFFGKKKVSLNISVFLKTQMLVKYLCQTEESLWNFPLQQHARRQNKSWDTFGFFIDIRSLGVFELCRFTTALLMIMSYLWPQIFIKNVRILCGTKTNNKKFDQESKTEKLDLQVSPLVLVDPAVLFLLHHQALPFKIKSKN